MNFFLFGLGDFCFWMLSFSTIFLLLSGHSCISFWFGALGLRVSARVFTSIGCFGFLGKKDTSWFLDHLLLLYLVIFHFSSFTPK